MPPFNKCSRCNNQGTFICNGCRGHFCQRDFILHREFLAEELERTKNEGYRLRQQIFQSDQSNKLQAALFSEIKKWHDTTVEKIRQTALKVRNEVNSLLQQNAVNIKRGFIELEQELNKNMTRDSISEIRIEQLRNTVRRVREEFDKAWNPSSIVVNVEQTARIDWNNAIHVEEKNNENRVRI